MDYTEFKELITDYVTENLSTEKKQEFELFLEQHPIHKNELEIAKQLWQDVNVTIPNPSSRMDATFYKMLANEQQKVEKKSILKQFEQWFSSFFVGSFPKQLAYTLTILISGFFFGKIVTPTPEVVTEDIATVKKEVDNVRTELVYTLLKQPSANKRLQAVNEVYKLSEATEKVIKAMFVTLNNDTNVNVRLSVVNVLIKYAHIPMVREGLVASIAKQNSPLVQIALADAMVFLQEKKAVKPLKKLIDKKDVNKSAKKKMEQCVERII